MVWPDFSNPSIWISLLTLTFLEIVLGVDNIIFISIVANKLPEAQQSKAQKIGLILALIFRVLLLLVITWLIKLTEPVFTIPFVLENNAPLGISWKDIILIGGGIFLIAKSTLEIHNKLERSQMTKTNRVYATMGAVLFQIVMVDAVFSFDSILTAVGLVDNIIVMIVAVVLSMTVMLFFAGTITRFVNRNPTIQMLALAFLIVIGILLVAQGFHQKISKSYVYTAMAFSLTVELLNMRLRKNVEKLQLNNGPLPKEK